MKAGYDRNYLVLSAMTVSFLVMIATSSQLGIAGSFAFISQPGIEGKDTYMVSNQVNRNYGTATTIEVKGNEREHSLLEFNLSGMPANVRIISATLRLYVTSSSTNEIINVSRVTKSWTEGTGNNNVTGDGATWSNATGGSAWTAAGGDTDSVLWASTTVTSANKYFNWDITELVRSWVNGTYPNYGLLMKLSSSSSPTTSFGSSDNGNASIRPNLTITYVTPPTWSNQVQNTGTPAYGNAVVLSTLWDDNSTLKHAWLSTNETGSWQNKTAYGSPVLINASSGWSNFSWQNNGIPAGTTVAWKMHANNTDGLVNSTGTMTFTISKAPSELNLALNGQQGNLTVAAGSTVNLTAILTAPSAGNLSLAKDGVMVGSGQSPLQNISNFTEAGTFLINASFAGNGNYTAGSTFLYLTVTSTEQPAQQVPIPGGEGNRRNETNTTVTSHIQTCPACPSPTGWSACLNGRQVMSTYLCDAATSYSCLLITDERRCEAPAPAPMQPSEQPEPSVTSSTQPTGPLASVIGPIGAMPGLVEIMGLAVMTGGGVVAWRLTRHRNRPARKKRKR